MQSSPSLASPEKSERDTYFIRLKKIATFSMSVLFTAIIGIPAASALLPSPREGECDPAFFPPFPDNNIGPGTLKHTVIPEDPKLANFIKDKAAAIVLGKALFWDMQVGSDGIQACASCHFRAGADPRSKNQLSPGGVNSNTGAIKLAGQVVGPNVQLTADMFPLTSFSDRTNRLSTVLRETSAVVSSQGVHARTFKEAERGDSADEGKSTFDTVFNVGGINTRRVEPRNTPTVINAAFFNKNFWDGRASNIFNGVNEFGAGDPNARVLKANGSTLEPVKVRLDFSSLASQAVGPIVSSFEMAFADRPRREVGKRLVSARALAAQKVHPEDSVLGRFAETGSKTGLKKKYKEMISAAFKPEWWNSNVVIRVGKDNTETQYVKTGTLQDNEYSLMEYNFSLFFGLAVQEYEKTLISDDAKIDQHFDNIETGGPGVLSPQEQRGMALFKGAACAACHTGPEFSSATFRAARLGFENPAENPTFQPPEQIERMFNGNCEVQVYEQGFYNIGIRPFEEDIGIGGKDPFGNPLNAADLLTADPATIPSPELLTFPVPNIANPPIRIGERTGMVGAFKTPILRNVELTAPYFHNGGQADLRGVIEFYNRGGDFHEHNNRFMDFEIGKLGLTESEIDDLVVFLKTMTDERVRNQRAPFDHPALLVPNGHLGNNSSVGSTNRVEADDLFILVPAVGRNGGPLARGFLE